MKLKSHLHNQHQRHCSGCIWQATRRIAFYSWTENSQTLDNCNHRSAPILGHSGNFLLVLHLIKELVLKICCKEGYSTSVYHISDIQVAHRQLYSLHIQNHYYTLLPNFDHCKFQAFLCWLMIHLQVLLHPLCNSQSSHHSLS